MLTLSHWDIQAKIFLLTFWENFLRSLSVADNISEILHFCHCIRWCGLELEMPYHQLDPADFDALKDFLKKIWCDHCNEDSDSGDFFETVTPQLSRRDLERFFSLFPSFPSVCSDFVSNAWEWSLQFNLDLTPEILAWVSDEVKRREQYGTIELTCIPELDRVFSLCALAFCDETRIRTKKNAYFHKFKLSQRDTETYRFEFGGTYFKWEENLREIEIVRYLLRCFHEVCLERLGIEEWRHEDHEYMVDTWAEIVDISYEIFPVENHGESLTTCSLENFLHLDPDWYRVAKDRVNHVLGQLIS